uniref:Coagulation factor IXa heavy chain n=1 Tax=Otus sunia TaxID=257818 RepID=A0A8C8AIK8_9STRI
RLVKEQCLSFCGHSSFLESTRKDEAHEVLKVHKRANYFLEEIRPGNLERECNEEKCSFEEAKEIFHSQEKTMEFWFNYKNLNPCSTNPCNNGGVCKVRHYNYFCICPPKFGGDNCEREKLECWYKNGGCWHYCRDSSSAFHVVCSCAKDYTLHEDGRRCVPAGKATAPAARQKEAVEDAAGQNQSGESAGQNQPGAVQTLHDGRNGSSSWGNASDTPQLVPLKVSSTLEHNDSRITGGTLCHRGHCPWQVLIRNSEDVGFCGGSLISSRWVVTAAHCLDLVRPHHVTVGENGAINTILCLEPPEERHARGANRTHDIALLYLSSDVVFNEYAVPVCLPSPSLAALLSAEGRTGTVSGWGATHARGSTLRFLMRVQLPIVSTETCQRSTARLVTDNMFCAGYSTEVADACKGDSGGPFTVSYHNTWFLLGIVSWGEGCAEKGKYGVYTRVSNYIPWIKEIVESVTDSEEFSVSFS